MAPSDQRRGPPPPPPGASGRPAGPAALKALGERHGMPTVDLPTVKFPLSNLDLIPLEIARRHLVVPFVVTPEVIQLAMGEPAERRVLDELEFVSGRKVFPYAALPDQIRTVIDAAYSAKEQGALEYAGSTTSATVHPPQQPTELEADEDLSSDDLPRSADPARPAPRLDSVFDQLEGVTGRTVLVVDDDDDIRRMVRRVLEDKGYHVVEADRGSTALGMVKEHAPDAIVLDAMLPELHGFEICRRIKSSVKYGHTPILMISAVYRGWRYAEDLKAAYGVSAYLEKPFKIADLVAAVEQMMSGVSKEGRDPEALTAEAEAALAAGMASYKRGALDEAIAHLEHAIRLDPLSYRLHYHLALLIGRKGDVFRAIQELEAAIDLHPKSFPALKNLAVLYQQAGFKRKAVEMWERAIGLSPDDETRGQIKEHLLSLL